MKREIIMILILISLVVIGHVVSQNYEKKFFTEINQDLNYLREELISSIENNKNIERDNDEDNENLKKNIENIKNKWEKKYDKLAYYIEHDELEKIETQMVLIAGYIELKDYDYGIIELDKCIFLIEHVMDNNSFQLVNMF